MQEPNHVLSCISTYLTSGLADSDFTTNLTSGPADNVIVGGGEQTSPADLPAVWSPVAGSNTFRQNLTSGPADSVIVGGGEQTSPADLLAV